MHTSALASLQLLNASVVDRTQRGVRSLAVPYAAVRGRISHMQ
jgi:hypothetical protein